MTQIATGADSYAAQFAASAQASALPNALASLRDDAFHCFDRLGFPTTRREEWRFSNVAPIAQTPFVAPERTPTYGQAALDALPLPKLGGPALVFVYGWFTPGVRARSLAEVLVSDPDTVLSYLGRLARIENHAFTALNTAFLRDGAVIEIGAGVVVDVPIHLVFITTGSGVPVMSQPRTLVLADANSQVRVVESHAGEGDTPYLNNTLTEIVVADGAVVDHYALVREAETGFRIGGLFARLGRASNFSSHAITLSGAIVRHEANVVLAGEGAFCTLNGLYLGNGQQLVDNQTTMDHAKPHCDSYELYKGILSGRSRAVFNGKIIVRLDAQKTDAKQSNKALLLSEDAQVTTKPQLEIFADDVKCTHGATVGQLDAESLFYLRSRALSEAQARQLLIHAFAADLLSHIKIDAVRRQLDTLLTERLPVGAGG